MFFIQNKIKIIFAILHKNSFGRNKAIDKYICKCYFMKKKTFFISEK